MSATSPSTVAFEAAYATAKPGLPGGADALRDDAFARFVAAGLPGRRNEGWKYTDLKRLERLNVEALAGAGEATTAGIALPAFIDALDAYRFVLLDGRFADSLSDLGAGQNAIGALSRWLRPDNAGLALSAETAGAMHGGLKALNAAMTRDGLVVDVPKGTILKKPIAVVHLSSAGNQAGAQVSHPRTILRIGEAAEVGLIEVFAGEGGRGGWTNTVLEGTLEQSARLGHVVLVDQPSDAIHTGLAGLDVGRDASYRSLVLSIGGRIARTETIVKLSGTGAHCTLAGGALVDGRRHVDHTSEISHAVPHTDSVQVFRNVIDDHGRSVFQGRVVVKPDAQKTDAHQSCRNLLLSVAAEANNKPELRIFADDVKCSHGATVGDLDADALFYLRARGIPEAEARALLTRAFVAELFDLVPVPSARAIVDDAVQKWLDRA